MRREVSSLFFARSTNSRPVMPSSRMSASISMTAWFAPPWSGPQSALMPAEIAPKRFTRDEPTRRTLLVEQFCSWSPCRMNSLWSARRIVSSTSYSSHGLANIMYMKFAT